MQLNTKIKGNDELYGNDIELIPLNLDAVNQRIEYFIKKIGDELDSSQNYVPETLHKYIKARDFWQGMKDKHCELETV